MFLRWKCLEFQNFTSIMFSNLQTCFADDLKTGRECLWWKSIPATDYPSPPPCRISFFLPTFTFQYAIWLLQIAIGLKRVMQEHFWEYMELTELGCAIVVRSTLLAKSDPLVSPMSLQGCVSISVVDLATVGLLPTGLVYLNPGRLKATLPQNICIIKSGHIGNINS